MWYTFISGLEGEQMYLLLPRAHAQGGKVIGRVVVVVVIVSTKIAISRGLGT